MGLHIMIELDALRARANAATDGPWERYGDGSHEVYCAANFEDTAYEPPDVTYGSDRPADAEFIAHARTDVPELIDEIERLQEAAERIPKLLFNEEQHALEIYNEGISGGRAADDPMMIHLNGRILGLQRARDIAARVLEGDSDD